MTGIARRVTPSGGAMASRSSGTIIWSRYRSGGIALVITMIALRLLMYRYHLIDIATARSLSFSGIFLLLGVSPTILNPCHRSGAWRCRSLP